MSSRAAKFLDQVDQLSEQDRAIVAAELELGPPENPDDVDLAWKQELARRLEELAAGDVQLEDTTRMVEELRAKYSRR